MYISITYTSCEQVWEWLDDSSGVPTKTVLKKYDEIKGNFFIGNCGFTELSLLTVGVE